MMIIASVMNLISSLNLSRDDFCIRDDSSYIKILGTVMIIASVMNLISSLNVSRDDDCICDESYFIAKFEP